MAAGIDSPTGTVDAPGKQLDEEILNSEVEAGTQTILSLQGHDLGCCVTTEPCECISAGLEWLAYDRLLAHTKCDAHAGALLEGFHEHTRYTPGTNAGGHMQKHTLETSRIQPALEVGEAAVLSMAARRASLALLIRSSQVLVQNGISVKGYDADAPVEVDHQQAMLNLDMDPGPLDAYIKNHILR